VTEKKTHNFPLAMPEYLASPNGSGNQDRLQLRLAA
jgi:hypothetical protein